MGADDTAADHKHIGRAHARHAAHQHAAPAIGLLQGPGADLRGEAAGHLGHRRQQRQAAAVIGHRLVGDGGAAAIQQVPGLGRVGGEVKIGKQKLTFAQHLALGGLGLLHLHDHVGDGEDFLGAVEDAGARRDIGGVLEAGPLAGAGLHDHLVTVGHRLLRGVGRHADAELLRLDLCRAADFHGLILLLILPECRRSRAIGLKSLPLP